MSAAEPETASALSPLTRLRRYLARLGRGAADVQPIAADASSRRYFRIPWDQGTAVAAVYPQALDPRREPFLDVTRLLADAGLPVPAVHDVDGPGGILILEDLGDRPLRSLDEPAASQGPGPYTAEAILLIARIQAVTPIARERNSVVVGRAFDQARFAWEFGFFRQHFLGSLRGGVLHPSAGFDTELAALAAELAGRPGVLCHRDYHTSNLMVDPRGSLRLIDYQDARLGPASYDLVTLLFDRRLTPPVPEALADASSLLLRERERLGLEAVDPAAFKRESQLAAIQRGLHAVGVFSYQSTVGGRRGTYAPFIRPTLQVVLDMAANSGDFPAVPPIGGAVADGGGGDAA